MKGHVVKAVQQYKSEQQAEKNATRKSTLKKNFIVVMRRLTHPFFIFQSDDAMTEDLYNYEASYSARLPKAVDRAGELSAIWRQSAFEQQPAPHTRAAFRNQQQVERLSELEALTVNLNKTISDHAAQMNSQQDEIARLNHELELSRVSLRALKVQFGMHVDETNDEDIADDERSRGQQVSNTSEGSSWSQDNLHAAVRMVKPGKRLSDITTSEVLILKELTQGCPYNDRLRMAMAKLCTLYRLSGRQARASFVEFAKLFGYEVKAPSDTSIFTWREAMVFWSKYYITDVLQSNAVRQSSITIASDETMKKTAKDENTSFAAHICHTSVGAFTFSPISVPDGTGLQMFLTLQSMLLNNAKEYFIAQVCLGRDIDVEKSANDMVNELFGNVKSFLGDRGSNNLTFIRAMEAWKTVWTEACETGIGLSQAEHMERMLTKYAEMCKAAVKTGSNGMLKLNCVLHLVSTFNGCFLMAADKVFETITDERFGSDYFSATLASLMASLEVRNDSVTSFGTMFHAFIKKDGMKHTTENTFWKSIGHREYAILHNCAVIMYWYKHLINFFDDVKDSPGNEKFAGFVEFLNRPEVISALRMGALVHHFWLMPLLSQATKAKGSEALQVQRDFQLLLQFLAKIDSSATVRDFINANFMKKVGYEFNESKAEVAWALFGDEEQDNFNFACDVVYLREVVAALAAKLEDGQPLLLEYYEKELSVEEKQQFDRNIENAPGSNYHGESALGSFGSELVRAPNERAAISAMMVEIQNNPRLFEYLDQLESKSELTRHAAKRSKEMIKQYQAQIKKNNAERYKRHRARSAAVKKQRQEAKVREIEELTDELQSCPGGLWPNMKVRNDIMKKIQKGADTSQQEFAANVLYLNQLNVRFWDIVVAEPNGVETELPTKVYKNLTLQDCEHFLEKMYQQFPRSASTKVVADDEISGTPIEMDFKANARAQSVTHRGVVVSRMPGDKSQHWYFVRFTQPRNKSLFLYNLNHEITLKNIKNVEVVRSLWQPTQSTATGE